MNEPVMIGTRGWDHSAWVGQFFPPELPEDWRLSYYSNSLRSVLVPQGAWFTSGRARVAQWADDSDPAFRFVLEVPAELSVPQNHAHRDRHIAEFVETIEPIRTRTAGLLLRIAPDAPVFIDWFEHLLNRLGSIAPVCVDLPENEWRDQALLDALGRQEAGLAWHSAHENEPHPGGRLRVALAPAAHAREVRQWIEKLVQTLQPGALAGLFFDAPDSSVRAAQEARIIAELMGV